MNVISSITPTKNSASPFGFIMTPERFAVYILENLNQYPEHSSFFEKTNPNVVKDLGSTDLNNIQEINLTNSRLQALTQLFSSDSYRDQKIIEETTLSVPEIRKTLKTIVDFSPFRKYYLDNEADIICDTIKLFFKKFNDIFHISRRTNRYEFNEILLLAAFDTLKSIVILEKINNPLTIDYGIYLKKASKIDLTHPFFEHPVVGRYHLKNAICLALGLLDQSNVRRSALPIYLKLIDGEPFKLNLENDLETKAEILLIQTFENMKWDFNQKKIILINRSNSNTEEEFVDIDTLFYRLLKIIEREFGANSYPNNYCYDYFKYFDVDDLVYSFLYEFELNLKTMNWL